MLVFLTLRTALIEKRGLRRRRSRLETYEDILAMLIDEGPSKTTHIMHSVNVNYKVLKEH